MKVKVLVYDLVKVMVWPCKGNILTSTERQRVTFINDNGMTSCEGHNVTLSESHGVTSGEGHEERQ